MENEPKPQANKENTTGKFTRRKFLKVVGGGLAGASMLLSGRSAEGERLPTEEDARKEREWLLRITVVPEAYRDVVVRAYKSLPPKLRATLNSREIEVTFKEGDILGGAAAADHFGLDINTHGVYIRWPADAEKVSFPWGDITLVDATRHEIAHIALERIFQEDSRTWVELARALQEEGPEFLRVATAGHDGIARLYSSSTIAHYDSLHEYLASLIEHCGEPVRVPLPTGRARSMVEELVKGGKCS